MDIVYKSSLLLLTLIISFLSLTTSSDGRTTLLVNQNPKNGDKGEVQSKGEDQKWIPAYPTVDYTSAGEEIVRYRSDPVDSLASMYFPASAAGLQDTGMDKDGQKSADGVNEALFFNRYPPGYYGGPPYGYPYPRGRFGFPQPRGIFGFQRGIFGIPRGIFGFPHGIGGIPGGYGGFPGGYGGNPGGYGGYPGEYGSVGPGYRRGGEWYPGYGGKAEVKGKEVIPHD